jgi:hypothetical protein
VLKHFNHLLHLLQVEDAVAIYIKDIPNPLEIVVSHVLETKFGDQGFDFLLIECTRAVIIGLLNESIFPLR